ncbi:hypothetical protein [Brevundimonas sp.]|uniref:hypothetical protein n=1 Tax=Brevundimonas sp. TaxID=1871086 RepID=UPI0025C4B47F|nr:hypothetical protein [Brevundimonas sp.]
MRTPMPLLAAVVAVFSVPCVAAAQQQAQTPRAEARVDRAAYVCATDEATRRSFEREYGAAPIFVTAEEALAAAAAGERWATPRCLTEAQHARLERLRRQTASKN